jgi:hypothetical protein
MTVAEQSQGSTRTRKAEIRRELDTHVNTLRDLGPEYTDSVAESFLDRIEQLVGARTRSAIDTRGATQINKYHEQRKTLAMIFAFSIPLLAIAGAFGGLVGVAVVGGALGLIAIVAITHNL